MWACFTVHLPSVLQIETVFVEKMAQSDVHHGEEAKEVKLQKSTLLRTGMF